MPEGPEVRRMAMRLAATLVGRPLTRLELRHPQLINHAPALRQAGVQAVESRGKAFLLHFGAVGVLFVHLELHGHWRIHTRRPPEAGDIRAVLSTDTQTVLLFTTPRIDLLSPQGLSRHPYLRTLGPDLLSPSMTLETVKETLSHHPSRALAELLLDQRVLAGIGNYLRAEILFLARLAPRRTWASLSPSQQDKLAQTVLSVIRLAFRQSGRTTPATYPHSAPHFVFARERGLCFRCGNPIRRTEEADRRFYSCPRCQS